MARKRQHLSRCHVFNNPHIPSHHTAAWRRGWIEAYGDDLNDAKNDDGTYGHGCTKYYQHIAANPRPMYAIFSNIFAIIYI
jgi:hypothetical protein